MRLRKNLIRYLPEILKRNLDFRIIMGVQSEGMYRLWDSADDVLYDQFITTAGEYGIARFEKILGIKPGKDDDLESRRAVVLMLWRRGGNPGMPVLQEMADIWEPGYTELEFMHPLMIAVWFTENAPYGPPRRLSVLMKQLRRLAPANVGFVWAYRYLLVKEVHGQMSVAELEKTPKKHFAGGSGMPDLFRGSGILRFGETLVVRMRSRINVTVRGSLMEVSSGMTYEAPEKTQVGDGLWRIDGALTVAAASRVTARTDGDVLTIADEEG